MDDGETVDIEGSAMIDTTVGLTNKVTVSHGTHTGDVTGVGALTIANNAVTTAKINDEAVTYAKMQHVSATDKILGRSTAGAGDVEEIGCTAFARTVLDDADAATARATLGAGTMSDLSDDTTPTLAGELDCNNGDLVNISELEFTEQADHDQTPTAGNGILWVKSTAPSSLVFTDDTGVDTTLGAAGGGISNVVEDTTPQLGGDLDCNGFDIQLDDAGAIRDDSGNEQVVFQKTATAVNHIEVTNAATGTSPTVAAAGDDAALDLLLNAKGSGTVKADGVTVADISSAQTLTNKTVTDAGSILSATRLTTGTIPAARIGADTIDAITEIASGLKSGSDATLVTGTAGTSGNLCEWDANGDAVDAGVAETALERIQRYRTVYIDAGAMVARTTDGAASGSAETSTNDHTYDYFAFDGAATTEGVSFKVAMPDEWDRSTVKAKFFWSPASGASASDGVVWEVSAVAVGDDDAVDAAYGTAVHVDDTVTAGTNGDLHVTAATAAITVGGTPALGDLVLFEVQRLQADANDDMAEDAHLLGVQVQYQTGTSTPSAW